jgi:hypothetical protein
VLLLVLVVVAILALGTNTYLDLMQTEHRAVRRHGRSAQAMRLAESGLEYLKAVVTQTPDKIQLAGGLANNANVMKAQLANDHPDVFTRGRFTILCPAQLAGLYNGVRYGLENESAKLNLHTLLVEGVESDARLRLLMLPGMRPEIADAILDWLDADSMPREYGAEQEYYMGLDPPYMPRNGPIGSLDELLQVRGITPELLYGLDRNRNLFVEEDELPRGALLEVDNTEGAMNRGWSAYLTITSVEAVGGSLTAPLVNLNNPDLTTLYNALKTSLTEEQAKFLILYRQYGQPPQGGGPGQGRDGQPGSGAGDVQSPNERQPRQERSGAANGQQPVSATEIELNMQQPGGTQIASVLDLIGAQVQVPATPPGGQPGGNTAGGNNGGGNNGQQNNQGSDGGGDNGNNNGGQQSGGQPGGQPGGQSGGEQPPPKTVRSPWQNDANSFRDLLKLCDVATPLAPGRVAGRINIQSASRPVLMSIPQLPPVAVEQILARRELEPHVALSDQRHALWLLIDGIVTLDGMRQLERFITTRGDAFSGQAVGFFDADSMPTRAEFVLDRSVSPPRLRMWRDLSSFGPGFSADLLGAVPEERR